MVGYTEDAMLITPDSVLRGHTQIREFFRQVFIERLPPGSTTLAISQQVIEGDIAYILWSANSAYYCAPLGTDTFVIRDGKIVAQTCVVQWASAEGLSP